MIKTYEKYISVNYLRQPEYEIGDYVKTTRRFLNSKILEIIEKHFDAIEPYYRVFDIDNDHIFALYHDDVSRKLSPSEIKKYKMQKSAKKYNL